MYGTLDLKSEILWEENVSLMRPNKSTTAMTVKF